MRGQILALTEGETDAVALMATLACEIHHLHPFSDWTGFYFLSDFTPVLLHDFPASSNGIFPKHRVRVYSNRMAYGRQKRQVVKRV